MINLTLVTVHGFWSSPTTWERLNAVWRADEELRGLCIQPFGYRSPKKPRMPFSAARVPDYDDIAQTLSTEYTTALAGASDIAIVTHSQGGLILQRFLIWMLNERRGEELARIRTIVMLACPNGGSEYLRSLRHILGYGRHAQAGHLEVLNRQVADTQRAVLQRIVNATGVDAGQCRIPFHVYAGNADRIVTPASAQGAFPGASALAGTHFSILDPTAPGNRTAETVKHHILTDIQAGSAQPVHGAPAAGGGAKMAAAADPRAENGKYVVDARGAHGLQIGEGNIQNNLFRSPSPEASEERLLQDQAGTPSTTLPRAGRPHAAPQSSACPVSAWDPHRLGVHPAITAEPSGHPRADLTPYVTRGHDAELRTRLSSPTGPVMTVLVGGSSTGKTRSALEAVRA